MNTVLAIVLISMFIFTPLTMIIVIAKHNDVAKMVTIAVTIVTHVTFWYSFQSVVEKYTIFAVASIYEMVTIVAILYIILYIVVGGLRNTR